MFKKVRLAVALLFFVLSVGNFLVYAKEKVDLKLIWKQRFDTVPANEESILSKPPEIIAEMIKPILKVENKLIFFNEQGKIAKEIELTEQDRVIFSKNGEFVVVDTEELPSGEEKEDETSAEVKVYDKAGTLLYKYDSTSSENHVISNTGTSVEINYVDCSFRMFDNKGNVVKSVRVFNNSGIDISNSFKGEYSGNGERFVIYATYYPQESENLLNTEVYIILYDNLGNELWRKKLENIKQSSEAIQISEIGDCILLGEDSNIGENNTEDRVFLLSGSGEIIKIFSRIRLVLAQLEFNSETSEFVVNPGLNKTYVITSSGVISEYEMPFSVCEMAISMKYIINVGREKNKENIILNISTKNNEVLLTRNLGGNKNDLKTLSLEFVGDDIIAISFSNEIRYYKISLLGQKK
ncbi:MAG: hypothetical protein PHE88_05440 [Elusimicrobia bacterium]|nr:hypothetical protein [Elusimicrobiota bacterium]